VDVFYWTVAPVAKLAVCVNAAINSIVDMHAQPPGSAPEFLREDRLAPQRPSGTPSQPKANKSSEGSKIPLPNGTSDHVISQLHLPNDQNSGDQGRVWDRALGVGCDNTVAM
jgi:hypothetical protein